MLESQLKDAVNQALTKEVSDLKLKQENSQLGKSQVVNMSASWSLET